MVRRCSAETSTSAVESVMAGGTRKVSYLGRPLAMGKTTKATRKFASSGQLKKTIQSRKKHQKIKKKIESRRGAKGKGKGKATVQDDGDSDDSERDDGEEEKGDEKAKFVHHSCYYYYRALMYVS